MVRGLAVVVLGMALVSCREECIMSCPLPVAVIVHVTAGAAAGPVDGAFVRVSGPPAGTASCVAETLASVCFVPGYAGSYDLEVGAPGFQTTRRTVAVQGTPQERCRCAVSDTVRIDVSLVRL
jgi:hypothetical protein